MIGPGAAAQNRALLRIMLVAAAVISVVAIFVWEAKSLGNFKIDDAYITFSFAKNLAAGNGPVYSHGLVRVEGYSNFLWMALLAAPLAVWRDLDPYAVARAATIPFLLGLALATALIARRALSLAWPWVWLCVLLLGAHADIAAAALSGLETVPYTAVLTLAFAAYLLAPAACFSGRLTIPLFVVAALLRIDGVVGLGFIVAFELVRAIRARAFSWPAFLRWALPGLAPYLAWFAWRWSYYGLPLPLPYYAKSLLPAALPEHGAEYAWDVVRTTGAWAAAPFIAIAIAVSRGNERCLALVGFAVVQTVYVISVGGDWMPFARFFLPIAPIGVMFFVNGLSVTVAAVAKRNAWQRGLVGAVCAAAFALVAVRVDGHVADTAAEQKKLASIKSWTWRVEDSLLPAAQLLRFVIRPGETLLTDYAGVFALYTDASVIDLFGLCNVAVGTRGDSAGINPVFGRFCPACYAEQQPTYLHVLPPMIRSASSFADHSAVIDAVFSGWALREPLDLERQYVAGRVVETSTQRGLFFLERRRPGASFCPRRPAAGIRVDYPFLLAESCPAGAPAP